MIRYIEAKDLTVGALVAPAVGWSSSPDRVVEQVQAGPLRVRVWFVPIDGMPTQVNYHPLDHVPVRVAEPVPSADPGALSRELAKVLGTSPSRARCAIDFPAQFLAGLAGIDATDHNHAGDWGPNIAVSEGRDFIGSVVRKDDL